MKEFTYKFIENNREMQSADEVKRRVFVEEQGISEPLVFSSGGVDEEKNIVVMYGEEVIGTARVIFPAKESAKIERMSVLKDYRHRGAGRGIIAFLGGELKRRQIKHVYLHAQHAVIDFYKECGFHETGEPFYEAGIKHVRMEMAGDYTDV